MLRMYFGKSEIVCKLRNGQIRRMSPEEIQRIKGLKLINLEDDFVEFMYLKRLRFYGWKIGWFDCFWDYDYDFRGKTVLDVGASIGESAVLFSLKRAVRIIAVEPDKNKVELMRLNLDLNGVTNVEIVDKGVSSSNSEASVTLSRLIHEYGPIDFLKVDCDGCEGEISEEIQGVPEVLIEWESNSMRKVLRDLRRNGYILSVIQNQWNRLGLVYGRLPKVSKC
jgi:hypothetical protein